MLQRIHRLPFFRDRTVTEQAMLPNPMASNPSLTRAPAHQEAFDPFAMQLALSTVHARLVPMRRGAQGYELDPSTADWFELPAGRGFAGYGLGRALRMLLDVLRGLTALHDTFDATGETFAHGDVALSQLRIDPDGVCRLVPLTARHTLKPPSAPEREALGYSAPERLLGEEVDVRSDVFSAGVLLWEALAGRRLFDETSSDAIVERLMGEKLQVPQLPPELAWAIPLKSVAARALSVDPYQRFADCAELATAISIVARERVAGHSEIATFFGAPLASVGRRALESVHPGPDESVLSALFVPPSEPGTSNDVGSSVDPFLSQHPIPTRSSTFRAVAVPSSGRTSTLAPLGPARSLTPPPSARATPAPSTRPASHRSPFSALLSADSRPELPPQSRPPASEPASEPASGRRSSTSSSSGAPLSAAAPSAEVVPETWDTPLPAPIPMMPPWAPVPSVPVQLLASSEPELPAAVPTPPANVTAELALESGASFRPRRARLSWALGLVILVASASALLAFEHSRGPTADAQAVSPRTATPVLPGPAERVTVAPLEARHPSAPEPTPTPAEDPPPNGVAPSAPSQRAPAPRAPAKAMGHRKDYGI